MRSKTLNDTVRPRELNGGCFRGRRAFSGTHERVQKQFEHLKIQNLVYKSLEDFN